MKYQPRPTIIEAFQLLPNAKYPDWFEQAMEDEIVWRDVSWSEENPAYIIKTTRGDMLATADDFIVKGVKHDLYPVKSGVFLASHEKIKG